MEEPLQYEGKRCVVTGCASGMGEATARILVDLGAEVLGLDIKETAVPVKQFVSVDLGDKSSIDAAVQAIGSPVDAVFSIAGLPGAPFTDLATMTVNFAGARHLIESLVPAMPAGSAVVCVASNAGLGWQQELATWLPLVETEGFDEAVAWCEANPDTIQDGYPPSKKALNVWVAWRGATLLPESGVRLNVINPGPTQTGMMPAFEAQHGADNIDLFLGPNRRRATPEEMAWPMVFLNSPRSSYISGEALHVDAGFLGAMSTGRIDLEALMSQVLGE
jgi:NAD(P)-dependent dehydrogenase (short-subunit alcohol dehydrogenase family)